MQNQNTLKLKWCGLPFNYPMQNYLVHYPEIATYCLTCLYL